MKQIEAVIFDWAGTTVDYGCMAPILALQEAFAHHHLTISTDDIRAPMGLLKIDHIKTLLNLTHIKQQFEAQHSRAIASEDINHIYQHFEDNIFSILANHSTVIDGVLAVQENLRAQAIKIGSTTGYTQKMIAIVAQQAESAGYQPDCIRAADQVKQGRPYPYMLHQNLEMLGIKDVRAVIKVGDTIVDIQEGLQAGCYTVGVIKGSSLLGLSQDEVAALSPQTLQRKVQEVKYKMFAAGAHYVIDTIDELPWVIKQLQAK